MHTIIPVKRGHWPEQETVHCGRQGVLTCLVKNLLIYSRMVVSSFIIFSRDKVLNEIFADPDSDLDENSEEEYEGESY